MEFVGHPSQHARRGALVCDDYVGYKALFALGITETGCPAHARRKFHELWENHKSTLDTPFELLLKFLRGARALGVFAYGRQIRRLDAHSTTSDPISSHLIFDWLIAKQKKDIFEDTARHVFKATLNKPRQRTHSG